MPKKVLIFVPDLFRGGIARAVEMLIRYLSALDEIETHVVVMDDSPLSFSIPENIVLWRLKIPWIARFGKTPKEIFLRRARRLLLLPVAMYRFMQIKRRTAPDIVVSHMSYLNLMALLLKGTEKVVAVDHVSPYEDLRGRFLVQKFLFLASKILYRRAKRVIAISKSIKKYYLQDLGLPSTRVVLIPNPVDLDRIRSSVLEEVAPEIEALFRFPVIVNVGRFTHAKGQWHLIRAFKRVKAANGEVKLLLIGAGELRERLENLARMLGCSEDIVFLDWQENPYKYIARATLFVFPSLCEGFGLALLEAMVCGVPVLASDIPSCREILTDFDSFRGNREVKYAEYGVLVPRPDWNWHGAEDPLTPEEQLLADSIVALLKNEELRRVYAAKARVRACSFSVEKVMPLWKEVLETL